ncbi:hypothetical protein ACFVHW_07180 [Streptomyces sp. NPDC127110]|uniref:hypothetical protein n=1 Tax=Streptomyces sp. NPDC127110 TaxID=3345362 RepID=UPI00364154FB
MREIPVQRAEGFYRPPPRLASDAWDHVPPAERVWRWYEQQAQRRLVAPVGVLLGEPPIYARINHGRWVADCTCGSAQIVTPADPRFACPECGYGWVQIVFPTDPAAAEKAVAERVPAERNWWQDGDTSWDRPPLPDEAERPRRAPRPGHPAPSEKETRPAPGLPLPELPVPGGKVVG